MLAHAGALQPRLADPRRGRGDPRERAPELAADEDKELARGRVGLLAPLLAVSGGAAVTGILAAHMTDPIVLDGLVGVLAGLLLMIAAVANHHLTSTAKRSEP